MTSAIGESIDALLGPSEDRYFGSRYLHETVEIVGPNEHGQHLSGKLSISHGAGWSTKKASRSSRAHLSTLDAISITGRLLGSFEDTIIESLRISAPTAPVEDLSDVVVAVGSLSDIRTTVNIGGMRVDVRHQRRLDDVQIAIPSARFPMTSEQVSLTDVRRTDGTLTCSADLLATDAGSSVAGLIAFTLVAAQLAQVDIYATEDMHRSESSTLWMRTLRLDRTELRESTPVLKLVSRDAFEFKGAIWAIYDYSMSWQNWEAIFSVAQALPAKGTS